MCVHICLCTYAAICKNSFFLDYGGKILQGFLPVISDEPWLSRPYCYPPQAQLFYSSKNLSFPHFP